MSNNDSSWGHHAWWSLWILSNMEQSFVVWFCKLKLVNNLLCLVLWSLTCQPLFCLSWPLQWEALSTLKGQAGLQKSVQPFRFCLTLSWKNPSHWRIAAPSEVCCIMFQVTHALSGTSSSQGQSKWDVLVFKYFLKETPIILLGAECYNIVYKGPYRNWSYLQLFTTSHKIKTTMVITIIFSLTQSLWFN